MQLIDIILDFVFPPSCGICEKIGEGYICEKCYKDINKYFYNNIKEDIFYLLQYRDIIRSKMISYKFNDKSYLYKMFCEIFVKNKNACEFLKDYDIMIPVPMHKKKRRIRGYNQTELIAKSLSKYLDIPVSTSILIKERNTPMQSSLGKSDRTKNIQNVYKVIHDEIIIGKNVVILDDIYTTGATVNECKRILKKAGAKKIGIIIIARD